MAVKHANEFVVGEVIKNSPYTPYSGSAILSVDGDENWTEVEFENGEKVSFSNIFEHEMKE